MDKKGMELALNTIVVAAIALIILVIMILIVTGNLGEVIGKFTGIRNKVAGKADCIILGSGGTDADNDGYDDKKEYSVTYKDDKGKKMDLTCKCDVDDEKASVHQDERDDLRKKYC